jgi:hypothetical protein
VAVDVGCDDEEGMHVHAEAGEMVAEGDGLSGVAVQAGSRVAP